MSENMPEVPGGHMQGVGIVTIFVGVIVGFVLGETYRVSHREETNVFNWTLAAIAFAPFFVGGVIIICAAAIIGDIFLAARRSNPGDELSVP